MLICTQTRTRCRRLRNDIYVWKQCDSSPSQTIYDPRITMSSSGRPKRGPPTWAPRHHSIRESLGGAPNSRHDTAGPAQCLLRLPTSRGAKKREETATANPVLYAPCNYSAPASHRRALRCERELNSGTALKREEGIARRRGSRACLAPHDGTRNP